MKLNFLLAILIASISFFAQAEMKKYYGIASARLEPQPEVKKEGSYRVNGVNYTTRTHSDTKDYAREGTASYYHNSLTGNPTSSGEPYHPAKFTAAHKTLPLGSYALVTNLRNNRKVIVKINDRGPFIKTRLIDLSKASAQEIGMIASGTANVRVEALHVDRNGKITGAAVPTLMKNAKTPEALERISANPRDYQRVSRNDNVSDTYKVRILNIVTQKQADELLQKLVHNEKMKGKIRPNGSKFEIHLENIAGQAQVYQLKNMLSKLDKHQKLTVYTYN
ncbi:MAG TPA: septal ring lytic transglycosylase RlpA family lipoprotein [Pasteurellaceae bacterium]|nr:septal ring lytic transglycosylase RlpA family lipoprotein [Pasteurellaceae bacterium]